MMSNARSAFAQIKPLVQRLASVIDAHRARVGAVGDRRQEFGELTVAMPLALRVARAAAVEGGWDRSGERVSRVVAAASLALPPKSGDLRATRPDRASSSWPTSSYASSRPCRDGSTILSDVRGPTLAIACEPCGRAVSGLNSILPVCAPGPGSAPLFLLTNRRGTRQVLRSKMAYTYLP